MERIASFSVDHLLLEPGVYVSRIDRDPATGAAVTTFDLRLTTPNKEPVMNTAECHTIEHLGATFLRNHAEWSSRIVYFGPMGCRTGFYLVVFGELTSSGKQANTTAGKLANTGDTAPSAIALAGIAAMGLGITATATRRIKNSK